MKKLIEIIDLKNLIYLVSVICVIMTGWFGFRERIAVLAADMVHIEEKLIKQENGFECMHKELRALNTSVIRIQVILEEKFNTEE